MIKHTMVLLSLILGVSSLLFATTLALSPERTLKSIAAAAETVAPFNLLKYSLKSRRGSRLFERSPSAADGTNTTNICCLPQVLSMKGTLTLISPSNNETLHVIDGGFDFSGDYNSGKVYQKAIFNIDGHTVSFESWNIKVSENLTLMYSLQGGYCSCVKDDSKDSWQPLCVPYDSGSKVSKAKIGIYDALKITANNQRGDSSQTWTFREPQMSSGKCWMLSLSLVKRTSSQEQVYYDMIEKVDPTIFKVPTICPPVDQCV